MEDENLKTAERRKKNHLFGKKKMLQRKWVWVWNLQAW
jgi:hypothetical protein